MSVSGKPSTSAPTTGCSQVRWQFINASGNSRNNLTRVKRHVMQEYMRQKRQAAGQSDIDIDDAIAEGGRKPTKSRREPKDRNHHHDHADRSTKIETKPVSNYSAHDPTMIEVVESFSTDVAAYPHFETFVCLPIRNSQMTCHSSYSSGSHMWYSTSQSGSSDLESLTPRSSASISPYEIVLSPKTILSAARTDPFNTLPLELDIDGQHLFDFYVNEMPACSYGNHFRSTKAHNWYTAVFVAEGMKGPVAFQNTVLVHAANTWTWVRNQEVDERGLMHRDRAISMLRQRRERYPHDFSDEVITACLSAAGLEDFDPRPGRKPISWLHMRAAREMVRARGGPAAFHNTRLGMLINWQDYILSGYETDGPSFFFEANPPMKQPSERRRSELRSATMPQPGMTSFPVTVELSLTWPRPLLPHEELQNQCDTFINFLQRCQQLSDYQASTSDVNSRPLRHTAFQDGSLLHQILAAPPGARFTASGNRKQFVARLVALLMLNAALWDYRNSVPHSEIFLQTLQQAVLNSEVNMSGSVEALLQILLECNDGLVNTPSDSFSQVPDFSQYSSAARTPYDRPWFAGRMLKVAKRLSYESWMHVNSTLFSCLTMQPGMPSVALWEESLRDEILHAPLTRYVMPSLEEP
ncbi:sigma-70 region 2 family protein [Aspergillus saccharolyticus JOP 1030-1]|uniref:Sigma-70 region 2 family protein n=1 Tax=Aspergillus saccharolyticus JOP 1030-1 TaxID=1450539 RepID=A0A318ZFK7_9EURO|nr:sigma-70 region 2 family protein [Aspergillus saccharolyticus JOP 1030-1]PYH45487.1 sigma-70 region 2 family protein [Aspergillus saccharolyticus JOP 1030-1]